MKIEYRCGYRECANIYTCDVGYWAGITCIHPNGDGISEEWYPVKILGVIE